MTPQTPPRPDIRLSTAPMMDWTDRFCRRFFRQFSQQTLIYTEMVTAEAILHAEEPARWLRNDPEDGPVALQVGGSDPERLAAAVKIAAPFGYREINLNVGCPSDRVQNGAFGACLMHEPALVAECIAAMREASPVDVTVKCRLGVDEQEVEETLPEFISQVAATGCTRFTIHARKAWLQGLSPKQNRDIPPLDYDLALRIKGMFPPLEIVLNGGIATLDEAEAQLERGFDGIMMGRAAYHDTGAVLGSADRWIFKTGQDVTAEEAVIAMLPFIEEELALGTPLNRITRHMLGAFSGRPGARMWRRILSDGAVKPGAGTELVQEALSHVAEKRAA
ncbi:MAG: tRNA dihydrouridine(20/20a) synthase DusA [Pseudomonadota bacterium]